MTQRTEPSRSQNVKEGSVITFSKRQTVAKTEKAYYFIGNPESNNEQVEVSGVSAVAGGAFNVDVHTDVTVDTPGTDMHEFNNRVGEGATVTNVERKYGGSYSDLDNNPLEDAIPGSTGNPSLQIGGSNAKTSFAVPPGNNLLMVYTNVSGADTYIVPRLEIVDRT